MFGDNESESPRVPSPWDNLVSSPPSPLSLPSTTNSSLPASIPKLVPEAEEGNVEYKLQLLYPSPTRFARLVTQLKWRLLEGGGQAYYEIGVADSGELVGLTKEDLERSLETLEEMAGEIGASIIVVKEIEVGGSAGKGMRRIKHGAEDGGESELTEDETTTATTTSTDLDTDDDLISLPSYGLSTGASQDARSEVQFDLDPALALFSMDPEPAFELDDINPNSDAVGPILRTDSDSSASSARSTSRSTALGDTAASSRTNVSYVSPESYLTPHPHSLFAIDLEIFSVYKPRPGRRRVQYYANGHAHVTHVGKRPKKGKKPLALTGVNGTTDVGSDGNKPPNKPPGSGKEKKADTRAGRRALARERRKREREEKEAEVLTQILGIGVDESEALADRLDASLSLAIDVDQASVAAVELDDASADVMVKHKDDGGAGPRFMVECLVVRKMSLEEAFLDFGGFEFVGS